MGKDIIIDILKKQVQEKNIPELKKLITNMTNTTNMTMKPLYGEEIFTKEEIKSFIDTLAHELTYNYQRRDEITNGLFPEYLLQENEYVQKENAFLYNNNDAFKTWMNTHVEIGNYSKYMNYTFDDQRNKDDTITFTAHILPYKWQRFLHLDYKYNFESPLEWIHNFPITIQKEIKPLVGKMNKVITKTNWTNISKLTNCNILVLPYSKDPLFFASTLSKYLIFFVDDFTDKTPTYYPVFLKNDTYVFDTISNDIKEFLVKK